MAKAIQFVTWYNSFFYARHHLVPANEKPSTAIRMGVLSTANINDAAIINPASTHADVVLYAVASRTEQAAQAYAKQKGIQKSYGSYQGLLDDPQVDAVYIPLPNGMHYEWAKKSLLAGKHVLLEKPLTSNASEARELLELSKRQNKVLLEAFHWLFHPAAHVVNALVTSGKYGKVVRTFSRMTAPKGAMDPQDIRWNYDLAGGALMDMTYTLSATRYFLDAGAPVEIKEAKARRWKGDEKVDEAMEATMVFESDRGVDGKVEAKIYADMNRAHAFGFLPRAWELPAVEIELEEATIYFYNYIMPTLYHYITIKNKKTGATSTQKHYCHGPQWGARGEPWWTTYRYQLEAFADKVKGRQTGHWISVEDSVAQMESIDMVYESSGLGIRRSPGEA